MWERNREENGRERNREEKGLERMRVEKGHDLTTDEMTSVAMIIACSSKPRKRFILRNYVLYMSSPFFGRLKNKRIVLNQDI